MSNRKKADILAELRRFKFRPFPKVSKAKAAGETEEVVNEDGAENEAEEAPGSTDYDYLLGMAIWSLTKEKVSEMISDSIRFYNRFIQIEKLLQQAAEKEAELLALLERTPIGLWNEDLDAFLKEWEVCGQLTDRLHCAYGEVEIMPGIQQQKFAGREWQENHEEASCP